MLNSSIPSSDPQNTSSQPVNIHPSHFFMNHSPPQFGPGLQRYHPHDVNQFLPHTSHQQFIPAPSSYQGVHYQGNVGQYSHGVYGGCASNSPASPVASMAYFGASAGSGSRGGDNSPAAGSGTPLSAAHRVESPVFSEEGSGSSPDESAKKGKGKNWSKKQDEWLVSAWLHNSIDSVDGRSKKSDRFWKEITAEYNMNAPPELKKSVQQCKNHWNKHTPKVSKFNAVYNELKSVYASGQSENQLMEKVRVKYMAVAKTKRPFPLEHWWDMVKKQQKWKRAYTVEEMNKRNKLDASGAHSSSTKETQEEQQTTRPPGQKKDKVRANCPGNLTNENLEHFNELQLRKSIAAEKMAAAALLQAENEKEKTKADKLDKYLNLIAKDTSDYSDNQKKRHEQVLEYLAKELGLD